MQGYSSAQPRLSPGHGKGALDSLAAVAARNDLNRLAGRLLELNQWLSQDLATLERAIEEVATADLGEGPACARVALAGRHLLALRGKRIRPLCVILAARMGGRCMDDAVRHLAVACEMTHNATLLHDDVIDDSCERRGAPTARVLYGNSASVLAGDHLLVQALRSVQKASVDGLLASLFDVIADMVAAEAMQLERRGRFEPSRAAYLSVIKGKTASLFDWGLRAGGRAGDLDAPTIETLGIVGQHLGMAFQLVDDAIDLEGDPQITGKEALVDLREGKLTWPVIVAAEQDASLETTLRGVAAGAALDEANIQQLVGRIRATGALQATRRYAGQMAQQAGEALAALPAGQAREALQAVIESAVSRAG